MSSKLVYLHASIVLARMFSTSLLTDEGMLASAETIRVVARSLHNHHVTTTVVDPV